MNSKFALTVSYFIAGSTGISGVAVEATTKVADKANEIITPMHTFFGLPLGEVAIIVGIMGTISTMTLQFLNWKDNHDAHKTRREQESRKDNKHDSPQPPESQP